MKKDLFKDEELNRLFAEQGFVKVNFLSAGNIAALEKIFAQHCTTANNFIDGQMYFSLMANSIEGNKKIKREVREVFKEAYNNTFKNFKPLAESFLAKGPGANGDLFLHQDWNYVDETQYSSATIWCPLVNITEQNGAMYLIPKSHLFFSGVRSSTYPTSRLKSTPVLSPHVMGIPVKVGEALIFHQALWHGSYPNLGTTDRVIATSIVIQDDAPFVYFHKNSATGTGEVYELGDDTFFEQLGHMASGNAPQNAKLISTFSNYTHQNISDDVLAARAAEAASKPSPVKQ